MKKIYTEYFQKSKVFLYPLLGIKKGVSFVPEQTYISWKGCCDKNSNKLLCLYSTKDKKGFSKFEDVYLKGNLLFEEYHLLDDDYHLYIFDLKSYKHDIKHFLNGKYASFSQRSKDIITAFFGEIGTISNFIESYLYPEYYYEDYAQILNVSVKDLESVGNLCDKPDFKKEELEKYCVNVELFN